MRDVQEEIQKQLDAAPVVLFMKGNPMVPHCGYSALVVRILEELGVGYEPVDLSADPELGEGIKAHSRWPMLPQLYARGRFIGGADLVRVLHEEGKLEGMLSSEQE